MFRFRALIASAAVAALVAGCGSSKSHGSRPTLTTAHSTRTTRVPATSTTSTTATAATTTTVAAWNGNANTAHEVIDHHLSAVHVGDPWFSHVKDIEVDATSGVALITTDLSTNPTSVALARGACDAVAMVAYGEGARLFGIDVVGTGGAVLARGTRDVACSTS